MNARALVGSLIVCLVVLSACTGSNSVVVVNELAGDLDDQLAQDLSGLLVIVDLSFTNPIRQPERAERLCAVDCEYEQDFLVNEDPPQGRLLVAAALGQIRPPPGIVAISVGNSDKALSFEAVGDALDLVQARTVGPVVLLLGFAIPGVACSGGEVLDRQLTRLSATVVVVAPSGEIGPAWPACYPGVVGVSASAGGQIDEIVLDQPYLSNAEAAVHWSVERLEDLLE